jgi:hypothetical protein
MMEKGIEKVDPPWVGERERPFAPPTPPPPPMPHASTALLEVGDLLPSFTDWGNVPPKDPATMIGTPDPAPEMSEEEWLRELARRVEKLVVRFGGVDRAVRRELELAARMLNSYAVFWERRNHDIREDRKKREGTGE